MNTFGASAYLKAEHDAVKETLSNLRERLKKLKIEELSIRSEIRMSMGSTGSATAAGENLKTSDLHEGPTGSSDVSVDCIGSAPATGSRVWMQSFEAQRCQQQLQEQDELSVNQAPLELDINEALKIISRYKSGGGAGGPADPYEDADGYFDATAEDIEEIEEEEEEDEDQPDAEERKYDPYEVEEEIEQQENASGGGDHFFDDFNSLGRIMIDESGATFDDQAGPSGEMLAFEIADERPAKLFKLDDGLDD